MKKGVESPHSLWDFGTLSELLLIDRQWVGGAGEAAVHVELPGEQMVRQLRETLWTKQGSETRPLRAGVSLRWRDAEIWVQRKDLEKPLGKGS